MTEVCDILVNKIVLITIFTKMVRVYRINRLISFLACLVRINVEA